MTETTEVQGFFPSLWPAGYRDPLCCERLSIDIRPLTPEQIEAVTAMLTEGVAEQLEEELFFSPDSRAGEPGLTFEIDFWTGFGSVAREPTHGEMKTLVAAITALAPDARVTAEIACVPTWVWHDDDEDDEPDANKEEQS